jgi:hypothetical protein
MKITHASSLTNPQLTAELSRLAHAERQATVALIVHLAEFDARRLLADGRLSPTTARLLKRYLTKANHEELLGAACGKSRRQVEELLARRFPQPDVPASICALPAALPAPSLTISVPVDAQTPGAVLIDVAPVAAVDPPAAVAPLPPPPLVRPLAPERYEIRFTASGESLERLRLAQDMLSHAVPSGDLAQVFDRAVIALLEDLARKRFAVTTRPRKSRGQSEDSDHIPAEVRRAVFVRDLGRCRFVSPDGRRCETRRFTQFHHVNPRGAGGKATVENIELRCGPHNRHEAELFYGPGKHRGGVDVVSEPAVVYRTSTRLPAPGRVISQHAHQPLARVQRGSQPPSPPVAAVRTPS